LISFNIGHYPIEFDLIRSIIVLGILTFGYLCFFKGMNEL